MSKDRSPWEDGRRAWKRLAAWFPADGRPAGDSAATLDALDDIARVRHVLDHAELVAVQISRAHGRSWSEIATRLGITRQSAWERWRDLDDIAPGPAAAVEEASERVIARVTADLTRRRRGMSGVPDVVGLSYDDARDTLQRAHLSAVNADPDAAPLLPTEWHSAVVVRQYPDSGTRVRAGTPVKLWVERGGGSAGVREPRRPKPPLREASAELDIDSVVGE